MPIDVATKETTAPWPDEMTGYAAFPQYQSWLQKTARGEPVTVEEHNFVVLHFAWLRDMLATPPLDVEIVSTASASFPFPFAVSGMGAAAKLMLGSRRYMPGDIVMPLAAPGGAALPATVPPPAGGTVVVTDAQRSIFYQNVSSVAELLSLANPNMRIVSGDLAPAGMTILAAAGLALGVVAAASFAYGLFDRYERAQVEAAVQVARVQEDAMTVRRVRELQAANDALAQRLAYAERTGQMPAPSPLESAPTANLPPTNPPNQSPSGLVSSLVIGAGALTVGAVVGAGFVVQDRRAKRAAIAQLV